jgi:hypothetical protein
LFERWVLHESVALEGKGRDLYVVNNHVKRSGDAIEVNLGIIS